jgi:hypothetical protein
MFGIMIKNQGVHAPVFVCDVCQKQIEDAGDGVLLYGADGSDSLEISVHKGCLPVVDDKFPYSHDLDVALVWLEDNLKFTRKARKEAEFRARMLEMI